MSVISEPVTNEVIRVRGSDQTASAVGLFGETLNGADMIGGLENPFPMEFRPSLVDPEILDRASDIIRSLPTDVPLLAALDAVHDDDLSCVIAAARSFWEQHDIDVYVGIRGGLKFVHDAWRNKYETGQLSMHYALSSRGWACKVFVKDKLVIEAEGPRKKDAANVACVALIYGVTALTRYRDIPVDRLALMSDAGQSIGALVSQPVVARRLIGHFGGLTTLSSVAVALSSVDAHRWVRMRVEHVDTHEGFDNLQAGIEYFSSNALRSVKLTGFGQAVLDCAGLRPESCRFYGAIVRAGIHIPEGRAHESVITPKMARTNYTSTYDMTRNVYSRYEFVGARLVFKNPRSWDIAALAELLVSDAHNGVLTFDTETAAFAKRVQLQYTAADVYQIASVHYAVVMQVTAMTLPVIAQLFRAVATECVLAGIGVRNDVQQLEALEVYARVHDIKTAGIVSYQHGINSLCKKLLDRRLVYKCKAVSVSDWSVLNLSDVQYDYAVDDVFVVMDMIRSKSYTGSLNDTNVVKLDASRTYDLQDMHGSETTEKSDADTE